MFSLECLQSLVRKVVIEGLSQGREMVEHRYYGENRGQWSIGSNGERIWEDRTKDGVGKVITNTKEI